MAGGSFAASSGGGGTEFEAKITPIVVIYCIMAATGGLMFGYDIGASVTVIDELHITPSMDDFLEKFFPVSYRRMQHGSGLNNNYCKYHSLGIQLFVLSLYLAGLVATFFASYTTRRLGRKLTMLLAGLFSVVGVVLNAAAQNLAMLIVGRILLGCGIGFANQVVPLFISEVAPTRIRGRLNSLFQLNITIGILFAGLVSYSTARIEGEWSWRLLMGLAGVPAGLLTLCALLMVDTPNSLIERGQLEEGKAVLKRIRGSNRIELEFMELVEASQLANQVKHPLQHLLMRRNRPQIIVAVALQIFQQLTGTPVILFYTPVLLNIAGFGANASLCSTAILGTINVLSTVVSIYLVDKVGRRVLLLQGGIQMFLSQVIIAVMIGIKVKEHSDNLNLDYAIFLAILICTFLAAFAWSWGPLGWLIPSEIFPLETRSAGQSVAVCLNFLLTFLVGLTFTSMLCHFKYRTFLFFAVWDLVMSFFVFFLLPETRNVSIEQMTERVWKRHWVWKRFMEDE